MAELLRAKESFAFDTKNKNGSLEHELVKKGELIVSDHPIVKAHKALFEPAENRARGIEEATAAPGEKRGEEVEASAPESAKSAKSASGKA